jgi:zinc transporter ZupT
VTLLEYILLIGSVAVGGGLAFYLRRNDKSLMQIILSFSGAYVMGITFLHLIPEAYEVGGTNAGLFILVGFFVQLLLEQLSRGIEHGHVHTLKKANTSAALSIMIGLCVHAFVEGIPLEGYKDLLLHEHHGHTHAHSNDPNHLLWGIIMHNIPASFALGVFLLLSGFKDKITLFYLSIFAAMSPIGALLSKFLITQNLLNETIMSSLLAVVIGSFLHIATTILFETDTNHKIPRKKLIAVFVGLIIAIFVY